MNPILIAIVILGTIGIISAIVLYVTSQKFAVVEDERIGYISEVLPQANCGGCGFPGCAAFAEACVKASVSGSLDGHNCPVGGQGVMTQVAAILDMNVENTAPKIAVVRCNGTCDHRPRVAQYDGMQSCRAQNLLGQGETGCAYGCLGCGDCVKACMFDAIHINPTTGLPEVVEDKCTACGACAKACPRNIIELRLKGPKNRRIIVLCNNRDKGVVANKVCKTSCIGCGKCVKVCEKFDAITLTDNLAYIDAQKCKLCRKCEEICPKQAIQAFNMPPRKPKTEDKSETQAIA